MLCLSAEIHYKGLFQSPSLGFSMTLGTSSPPTGSSQCVLHNEDGKNNSAGKEEFWCSCDSERIVSSGESRVSDDNATTSPYRLQLEHDIKNLQAKLHGEMQLHAALESAVGKTAIALSCLACLPDEAQDLLKNIAVLEDTVSKLEEELVSLHFQLSQERNERRLAEYRLKQSPSSHFLPSPDGLNTSEYPSECLSWSLTGMNHSHTEVLPIESSGLHCSSDGENAESKSALGHACPVQDKKPQKLRHLKARRPTKEMSVKGLWHHPNQLSEEMVRCMKNIYICLADSSNLSAKSNAAESFQLPTSPHGHLSASSLSSVSEPSELSIVSLVQSPVVELHCSGDVLGDDNAFDPYKVRGKLSWADIGNYSSAVEVSWMSVGKQQLEYAAGALRKFKSLVEQLAKVNPTNLCCDEKLAFWINLYNALIMHAYLAYGVPKSELKLFSLMQKAAYTVGGHSFSAAAIEYVILKMKPPVHRPQTALLLALHKLKTSEGQRSFSVDSPDPLVTFALSSGMYSSPAVRIYTAAKVREELQQSLRDYVRASVGVSRKGKLFLPKMLHCFAKSVVDDASLSGWICQFLPPQQAAMVEDCMSQRRLRLLVNRNCAIVPFDSRFRYLFLPENLL
ncbi:uncharacterized protein LOC116247061 [Nymphaea colorata]|uniref:uncharacterized protein LOC116247061 n=1 Tax=Nymphaea colorata TaxID=210225 RepID=UPI00129D597A|nr:uncharacterized protein LOC116247061 [Nymphaea colorata]XP_031474871.1 uncharacterized protein LOC116247061 [Nymphaea colorata]